MQCADIKITRTLFNQQKENDTMQTFLLFQNLQEARDYRYINGTGGWIFEPEKTSPNDQCILFPPEISPSGIFHHQLTKGKSGRLIGNQ